MIGRKLQDSNLEVDTCLSFFHYVPVGETRFWSRGPCRLCDDLATSAFCSGTQYTQVMMVNTVLMCIHLKEIRDPIEIVVGVYVASGLD